MQRDGLVSLGLQGIIDRGSKFRLVPAMLRIGEEIELAERFDIHLGERLQFFRGRRLAIAAKTLGRKSRIHLVESPGVAETSNLSVGAEQHLAFNNDPDMRVRGHGERRGDKEEDCGGWSRYGHSAHRFAPAG